MYRAKLRDQWNQTAAVMALIANCFRDPKKGKKAKPSDFIPESLKPDRKDRSDVLPGDIADFQVFLGKRSPKTGTDGHAHRKRVKQRRRAEKRRREQERSEK